jgi:phosphoribosylformylglycinamidine synthase
MAFAGRCGLEIELVSDKPVVDTLFAEELGMILQIRGGDDRIVRSILGDFKLTSIVRELGRPVSGEQIRISVNSLNVVDESRITLHKAWSETSWVMQSIRDNPECATEE